jgi:hypothetical protein
MGARTLPIGATAFLHLRADKLEQVEILLHPLSDQKRMAILSAQIALVKRARAAVEAQLDATEALPATYLCAVFDSLEAQQWPRKCLGEITHLLEFIPIRLQMLIELSEAGITA